MSDEPRILLKVVSRDELDRYLPLIHSRRLVALPVPA